MLLAKFTGEIQSATPSSKSMTRRISSVFAISNSREKTWKNRKQGRFDFSGYTTHFHYSLSIYHRCRPVVCASDIIVKLCAVQGYCPLDKLPLLIIDVQVLTWFREHGPDDTPLHIGALEDVLLLVADAY